MKKIFSPLLLILPRFALWFAGILLAFATDAQAFTGSLVEDWGWFPERAGIIAAESWGIKPQWQGKTLVESYQAQSFIGNQPLLVRTRMVAAEPLPNLPPPVQMPVVPAGFCEIIGEVSDDKLEPVSGAVVEILGTGKTATTIADGSFSFSAVASGNLTLEASKLGYSSDTQSATAIPGQKLTIRMVLKVKAADGAADETMLEEETVVGEYQENNQGDFNLNINMDAPKLTASMGREEFTKAAVTDAGQAIAKISGANIVDGKYAVVRGLADRYVTTTFNGAQIASADPSRKAVQLDLFPTTAIESINIDKTYSPELPGDFGGGTIDIVGRAMPTERLIQFNARVTYNDQLKSKTLAHPNRDLGFFGDVGDNMPSVLESRNPDGTVKFLDNGNTSQEEITKRWKQMHESQSLRPKEDDTELGYATSFAYGETFVLPNQMKLGLMTAFGRSSNDSFNSTPQTNQIRSFERNEYVRSAEWGAYIAAALELNEYNVVQATFFKKHIAQDEILETNNIVDDTENLNYGSHLKNSNINPNNFYGPDAIYYGAAIDIIPLERNLDIFQLKGNHSSGERAPRYSWAFTQSSAIENRPHSTHFEFGVLDFSAEALAPVIAASEQALDDQAVRYATLLRLPNPSSYNWETIKDPMYERGLDFIYDDFELQNSVIVDESLGRIETSAHGSNSGSVPGKQRITRRTEQSEEDATHGQASGVLPYFFFKDRDDYFFEFGFGASNLSKKRNTTARMYDLVIALNSPTDPGFPPGSLDGQGGLGEQIANNPDIISDYFNGTTNTGPYYTNSLTLNGLENIRTRLDQFSYYYSGLLQMGKHYVSGGVRFEKESYEIDIAGSPLSAFTDEQIEGNGWENRDTQESMLPSLTAGTALFDDQLAVQFAWSKTVARPTFWEFIPSQTLDQSTGLARRGNNTLAQTEIDNFDFSMTFKPTDDTLLRASFFHKNLTRPLVTFLENGTLLYADSNINATTGDIQDFEATINGVELEAEVANIGPFSLRGNFTYIDAQLDYFYNVGGESLAVVSKLPYQPTYLANINLGYEYEPWKLTANLLYNYNGDYPIILKLRPEDQEVTRNSLHTFDLVLSKLIETQHVKYTLRGGVRNMFDAADTYLFGNQVFDSTLTGRSYWMEIQMNF
jgi:hypothetical protein